MNSHAREISSTLTAQLPAKSESRVGNANWKVQLVNPADLSGELADCWNAIRYETPSLSSPYFDVEFTRAVARIRDDVEIAVLHDENGVVGFLPFQRVGNRHAEPVGGRLNDVHGLIMNDQSQRGALTEVLKQLGLNSFGFHAAVSPNAVLDSFRFCELDSHHLDLSNGWEDYYRWVKKHSRTVKRHGQKARALERDLGELRFEFQCDDPSILEELIDLKRAKYQRSKTFDILSVDWAADLLREIHKLRTGSLEGVLSVLWAGDSVVAVHMGMLTDNILHYWFPVFALEYSKYSPGTELFLRVTEEACRRGIRKLDLGYGDDAYKFKFCNASDKVQCGLVTKNKTVFHIAKTRYVCRQKLKQIPMKPTVKRILRKVYPGFGGWNFK